MSVRSSVPMMVAAVLVLGGIHLGWAEEPAPKQGGEKAKAGEAEKPPQPELNPEAIAAGASAFPMRCTKCHDAGRATNKRKSLAGWRNTVRRMANKSEANIPASDWEPIATYLASLNPGSAEGGIEKSPESSEGKLLGGRVSLNATLAPLWRGGTHDNRLENSGFFPDTWITAEWQGEKGLSARVTSCVTCHTEGPNQDRIALAEAALRFDFNEWLETDALAPRVAVEAGRAIVPFGAIAAQIHPGTYRTVTRPLIFMMGQHAYHEDIGTGALPMPYADEGVFGKFTLPCGEDLSITLDGYLVNGLQGDTDGVNFDASRDYADNNSKPALGCRGTVGTARVQFGGSYMAGRFNDHLGGKPFDQLLDYEIMGVDVTARLHDCFRCQFEYALRNSDRYLFRPNHLLDDEEISGFSLEGELRVCSAPFIWLVARYDTLSHRGDLVPPGSSLTDPRFTVYRFTWGFTFTLPGGSLLLINHEHWNLPETLEDIDMLGLRWIATF